MTKIIFELDEIERILTNLQSVVNSGQRIDSSDFKKLVKQTAISQGLDEYEQKVFEYIRNNPRTSIQGVVDAFEGSRSRVPVINIINKLVNDGLVIKELDPKNVKRYQLFENKRSLILRIENDIKNFKKSYLNLLKRANQEYIKKQNLESIELEIGRSKKRVVPEIYSTFVDIDLSRILQQLIKGYALKAIFEWPKEIKDSESLNRLYLMVFHMLGDIFSDHAKYSIPFGIQDEDERVAFLHESFRDEFGGPFGETILYLKLIRDFNKYDWDIEFDTVMSDLFTALNTGIKWKEYRRMLVKDTKKHP